jgi:ATP synthase protein I
LNEDGGPNTSRSRAFFRAAQFASVGIEMGIAVAIGAGIGYLLDSWLGTAPWLLLLFLLFGVAAGFKGLIDASRRATSDFTASKERKNDDGS